MSGIGELYNSLRGELLAYLRNSLRVDDEAEDIVQDAFLRLLMLDRLEDIGSEAAYLYTAVRNLVIDRQRTRHEEPMPQVTVSEEDEQFTQDLSALIADTDHAPDTLLQRQEIHKAYQAALAELPEPQREVWVQTEEAGLSFNDLAAQTGTPPNTLLSRKHYAVQHLRKRLQPFMS